MLGDARLVEVRDSDLLFLVVNLLEGLLRGVGETFVIEMGSLLRFCNVEL